MNENWKIEQKEFEELILKAADRFVPPHKKVSRPIVDKDYDFVMEEVKICNAACYVKRGKYPSAFAIAHPQINDKDPVRMFVFANGIYIMNPRVIRYSKTIHMDKEGCLSYSDRDRVNVFRYHKLTLDYDIFNPEKKLVKALYPIEATGQNARIVQHELDHLNGVTIYDIDFDGTKPLL